jgi:pyruvate/2-oxoglutarate dehydrogenase complex dihydrolipoamide acyltransferase (E2) component
VSEPPAVGQPLPPAVAEAVRAIYAAADREVAEAGPRCEASGRCCRFTEWGHVLFLSHLELAVLLDGAPAYTKPVGPDGCPFQVQRLCTAREQRPLGCRVYFCDPAYQERAGEITEKYLGQLKELAHAHDLGWQYAPLHVWLNAYEPPPAPAATPAATPTPAPAATPAATATPAPPPAPQAASASTPQAAPQPEQQAELASPAARPAESAGVVSSRRPLPVVGP